MILTVSGSEVRAVFAHRVDSSLDWAAVLGMHLLERSLRSPIPVGAALPAGRWDDSAAYVALARLETLDAPAVLCLLRHQLPFDSIELSGAESARALLVIGSADSQVAAREVAPTALAPVPDPGDWRLRVLIAESQPATRTGLEAILLRTGLQVIGATASCAEAVVLARDAHPDVMLVDLALSDAPNLTALKRLAEAAPLVPLIAFANDGTPEHVAAVVAAGAWGLVTKDAPPERITAALRAAASGLTVTPRMAPGSERSSPMAYPTALAADPAPTAPAAVHLRDALTPRELDLLRYLAEGHTNKEIARAMVLAEDTVKKAVQTVIAKLGATDRTSAVVIALRNALIE